MSFKKTNVNQSLINLIFAFDSEFNVYFWRHVCTYVSNDVKWFLINTLSPQQVFFLDLISSGCFFSH